MFKTALCKMLTNEQLMAALLVAGTIAVGILISGARVHLDSLVPKV